jgi:hypothetical protein
MELNDDIIRHRTTPSLLFAPMIAHDDRQAWMRRQEWGGERSRVSSVSSVERWG